MRITELCVPDAFRLDPELVEDDRGLFYEQVRYTDLRERTGVELTVQQVNYSVSRRNVLRGVHTTPGEPKFISCVRGIALDVALDVRLGSPTFGQHAMTRMDARLGTAVYLPDGFAHGFLALTDDVCMSYIVGQEYTLGTMIGINAFDPELDLAWNLTEPAIRSDKDAAAPSLAEVVASGLLPSPDQLRVGR